MCTEIDAQIFTRSLGTYNFSSQCLLHSAHDTQYPKRNIQRKNRLKTHAKYPLIALARVFVSYSISSLKSGILFLSVKNKVVGG